MADLKAWSHGVRKANSLRTLNRELFGSLPVTSVGERAKQPPGLMFLKYCKNAGAQSMPIYFRLRWLCI